MFEDIEIKSAWWIKVSNIFSRSFTYFFHFCVGCFVGFFINIRKNLTLFKDLKISILVEEQAKKIPQNLINKVLNNRWLDACQGLLHDSSHRCAGMLQRTTLTQGSQSSALTTVGTRRNHIIFWNSFRNPKRKKRNLHD